MSGDFIKTNYHCHTLFCDGKNSVEEMVEAAAQKGFSVLGLSGHSMYPFAGRWHIAPREHGAYSEAVRAAAEKYRGQIEVLCGFEADYVPFVCAPDYRNYAEFNPDFLVGSVHYVTDGHGYFEADGSAESVSAGIKKMFNGSARKAVQTYFALEREMLEKGNFTFLGHADLIRMQNKALDLFDEKDGWYVQELKSVAKAALRAGVCVEINMGGMARGYFESPYPSLDFLRIFRELGVPAVISSDAHRTEHLDFGFDYAVQYAREAGYKELHYLTAGSLKSQRI